MGGLPARVAYFMLWAGRGNVTRPTQETSLRRQRARGPLIPIHWGSWLGVFAVIQAQKVMGSKGPGPLPPEACLFRRLPWLLLEAFDFRLILCRSLPQMRNRPAQGHADNPGNV